MARGLFRKTSFNKMVGAYRSQWKRFWMRLFTFGMYGRKGMGWLRDPKRAWYNFWYHRTSISIPRMLGYKPSGLSMFCAVFVASIIGVFAAPVDAARAGVKAHRIKAERRARSESNGTRRTSKEKTTAEGTKRRSTTVSSAAAKSTSSPTSIPRSTSGLSRACGTSGTGSSGAAERHKNTATSSSDAVSKRVREERLKLQYSRSPSPLGDVSVTSAKPASSAGQEIKESDKDTSKSKPSGITKNTSDPSRAHSPSRTSSSGTAKRPKNATEPKPEAIHKPVDERDQEEKSEFERSRPLLSIGEVYETPVKPVVPAKQEINEPDENTPKSKPKHDGDRYIRKRMIIAGSSYCDKTAKDRLTIGAYLELVAEPTNPYDKDAVMLVHDGEKIGYIAKQDKPPFVASLKLKRKVYGVITDIITESNSTKYEFETWFDSETK